MTKFRNTLWLPFLPIFLSAFLFFARSGTLLVIFSCFLFKKGSILCAARDTRDNSLLKSSSFPFTFLKAYCSFLFAAFKSRFKTYLVPYHGPKMTLALRKSGVGCSSMTRVKSVCISWSCAFSVWL